ncbi:MAG: hypothetical protein Q8K63_05320 [Acidimicrobiales bacterium]|nr:hypothetical protein [Acidimicrobiales bacterium]
MIGGRALVRNPAECGAFDHALAVSSEKEALDAEPWTPFSVGMVFGGGGTPTAIEGGFRRMAHCVEDACKGLPAFDETAQASVNLIFHVAGMIWVPEFEGLRTGSWFGKDRLQIVQAAIPSDLSDSIQVNAFFANSVDSAVGVAAEALSRFRRSRDLSTEMALLAATDAAWLFRRANDA